jgi:hypothetical protein
MKPFVESFWQLLYPVVKTTVPLYRRLTRAESRSRLAGEDKNVFFWGTNAVRAHPIRISSGLYRHVLFTLWIDNETLVTLFTKARYGTLCRGRWIQSVSFQPVCSTSIIKVSIHLLPCLPIRLTLLLLDQNFVRISIVCGVRSVSRPAHPSWAVVTGNLFLLSVTCD